MNEGSGEIGIGLDWTGLDCPILIDVSGAGGFLMV